MVNVKNTTSIVSEIKYNFVTNVSQINDINIGSNLDVFITAISIEINGQYQIIKELENNVFVDTSTGTYLDRLGLEAGVKRKQGSNGTGNVSFIRTNPATSDFTILSGTQVSTTPTTSSQLVFSTNQDTIFKASITGETQNYLDGIEVYKFSQRLVNSITNVTGTSNSISTSYVENTNFTLVDSVKEVLVDTSTLATIDNCDSTIGWITSADSSVTTNTLKKQGTNSLNLIKTGTTQTFANYSKILSSTVDLTTGEFFFYMYILDQATLSKIQSLDVFLGSNGNKVNSYQFNYSSLKIGWNLIHLDYSSGITTKNGSPNISTINYIEINTNFANTTTTVATGSILLDFLFNANYSYYTGKTIHWIGITPDANTSFSYDYIPLSVDIPVTALSVGTQYNVFSDSIIYKVSNLVNIDSVTNYDSITGGVDKELDTDYRIRITTGRELLNVSTVSALEASLNNLSFVKTAKVTDMPIENIVGELHVYDSTISKYKTNYEVPINNSSLIVGASIGVATYTKDVDYVLTSNGEISWISANTPVNGANFYITYDRNKLGWFNVLASGVSGVLNSTELSEMTNLLDITKKSAGIKYTITQPTQITVVIDVTLSIDTNYSLGSVKTKVNEALNNYIFSVKIGEDILLAKITSEAMKVAGVNNVVVNSVNGASTDLVITSTEVAVNGTHIIN